MHVTAEPALKPRAQSTRPAARRALRHLARAIARRIPAEHTRRQYSDVELGLAFVAGVVLSTCAVLFFIQPAL